MSVTLRIDESESVSVGEERIETEPPDRLAFRIEGTLSITERVLSEFEGATLDPSRIEVSAGESETVDIDLTEDASLRLSAVDVGVEIPDAGDRSEGMETLRSSVTDPTELADARPAAIAFTVEGSISNLPVEAFETLSDEDPMVEALTFDVDDPVRSDGGSDGGAILEIGLFGYGIVVRRDGAISVGTRWDPPEFVPR